MFTHDSGRIARPRSTAVFLAAVLIVGSAPAAAQEPDTGGAPADTGVVSRLERVTAHFRQMLRTLEQNPALEEQWAGEMVLAATVRTGTSGSRAARQVDEFAATLDSLSGSPAADASDGFARRLSRIERDVDRMLGALREVAGEMESLRAVAHREVEGQTAAHVHSGAADTTARGHGGAGGHHSGLHFAHPLATESVSPDTKLRINYDHRNLAAGERENAAALAAEWSPHRSFSVEASVPYSFTAGTTGFSHVALKFASYAFENAGVSLGYGVGLGLPTSGDAGHAHEEEGHTHGSRVSAALRGEAPDPRFNGTGGVHSSLGRDLWTFEPFLNVGWKTGRWELVGFGTFEIPTNQAHQDEVGTELAYNASALFRAAPEVQTTLELHGHAGLSGHATGEAVANLTPGVKLRPSDESPFFLGIAGSFPVSADESYDARALVSLFYHFH